MRLSCLLASPPSSLSIHTFVLASALQNLAVSTANFTRLLALHFAPHQSKPKRPAMRFTLVTLATAALLSSVSLAAPTASCKAICQNECKATQLKEGLECGPSDTRHCARTVESNAYNCNYLCETTSCPAGAVTPVA